MAILATFLGICNVKDDNVVQAMLAAQAEKIDQWNFFQARNIREEVMLASDRGAQARAGAAAPTRPTSPPTTRPIARYTAMAKNQNVKKEEQKKLAEDAQVTYDKLNYKDDQFDLAEASIAIAIALLADHRAHPHLVAVLAGDDSERVRPRDRRRRACSACRSTPTS